MSENVSEILETAADVIEKRGWTQGVYVDANGVCMLGAISTAVTGDPRLYWRDIANFFPGQTPVVKALSAYLEGEWPPQFNDRPGRTKQEVLDALRGAAKQERIKEENANV